MFCHFWEKFENSKWPPFLGRGNFFKNCQEYDAQIPYGLKLSTKSLYLARFLKIAKSTFLRYPVGRKFRRNRSISHGLGDMSTFAFFSTQNSQLLIYLINYSLIYEAIPPKSNPIQAINPMNLYTKFQKDRLNSIP